MKLIIFLFHYGLALSYLFLPFEWTLPYTTVLVGYLFLYYGNIKKSNAFTDIHPFLIGYGSFLFTVIYSGAFATPLYTPLLIVVYLFVLYKKKGNEENFSFHPNQVGNSIVYTIILPFSVYLGVLYIGEQKEIAFMCYYASLFYGLFNSRNLFRFNVLTGFLLMNVCLLMLYGYQYAQLTLLEEIGYMCLIIGTVFYQRFNTKKQMVRG